MQKEFIKYNTFDAFVSNFNFCPKMGVALPRPSAPLLIWSISGPDGNLET